jgi:hypothetical protein
VIPRGCTNAPGDGGHNVNALVRPSRGQPAREPQPGSDASYLESKPAIKTGGLLLEKYNDTFYGYLRITVSAEQLRIGFHLVGTSTLMQSRFDLVTVDLASHTVVRTDTRRDEPLIRTAFGCPAPFFLTRDFAMVPRRIGHGRFGR